MTQRMKDAVAQVHTAIQSADSPEQLVELSQRLGTLRDLAQSRRDALRNRCCVLDDDLDGNCPVHLSRGVLRASA